MPALRLLLVLLALTGAACPSHPPDGLLTRDDTTEGGTGDSVSVRFLGTSGLLVQLGEDAFLTDPFFSNPGIAALVSGRCLEPDAARIGAVMPARDAVAPFVSAVLVGQGHHDHLMDVPFVVPRYAPSAVVFGSATAAHLIAASGIETRAVNQHAANHIRPGAWMPVPGASMRILPLQSEHAPQVMGVNLVTGTLDEDRPRLPCASWDWLQGEAFAFLVDFLDDAGRPVFRMHFQDSATNAPKAFHPPHARRDGVAVDVAFLPVASFDQVEAYPEALLEHLAPRHVVLHHWDDFFVDPREDVRLLRGQDLAAFVARLEAALPDGTTWAIPARGATLRFPVVPR